MTTVIIAIGSAESNQRWAQVFQALQPNWHVHDWNKVKDTIRADFAIVWQPSNQLFADQPYLKAIFNIGAGVDGIDFSQIPTSVPVYRVEDAGMAVQMAEYAVYGTLLATQRFQPYVAAQKEKKWHKNAPILKEQWPIGIMGFGQIGQKVAQVLKTLGYPVSTWVRSPRASIDGIHVFSGAKQLGSFLSKSRILINVLPLTDETKGIINAANLSQLPANSFFINMARGPHVIESDLIAALDSGHLTGALLDVFNTEPLPPEHIFWTHPNIYITPHISGVSLRQQTAEQISSKINTFLQHQPISGLVERERMY